MQREIKPFRVTLILDGDNAVAQLEQMERIYEDDGVALISARALPAEPLAFPLAKKFLDKVTAETLVAVEKLTAAQAAKESAHAEALAAKDAKIDDLKAKQVEALAANNATIATLTAELHTAKAALESARSITRDNTKDKGEKYDALRDVIAAALLTDKQRKRKAIQDEIAKLSAALAAADETP
jgi:hypothetical protein